ncbi:MAG TPA: ATP-binding cassette domain-containing protein [Pyrinomonadaceae bacterium]|nr:ATP-binding cassette domain-containing protein [Pyrinomonadaceae bacterium]
MKLLIPEVVQTSMMDCGPASLKAMLEGWGIPVSYGRLREACQTDVDGTSIDTLEDVGAQLGLSTEQIMVPVDHLLLESANTFPAIVVVMHPSGVTHFVIAWRKHGNVVQLMDPAIGRRWVSCRHFLNELYVHKLPVPAADWREWAGSNEFLNPLRERLDQLRISSATQTRLIEQATSDSTWRGLATLDATTRMLAAIVRARGIKSGAQAARMLEALTQNAHHDGLTIPSSYWSVRPLPSDSDDEQLLLRGAVLVRVKGVRTVESDERPLSPELVAALNERPLRPMRELFRMFRADGVLMPLALLLALAVAAGGVIFESLLFRRLLEIGNELVLSRQRLGAAGFLLLFLVALLLLDLPLVSAAWNLGRRLEMRLRIAFLEKLPRLSDRYFHSRLTSDMAERAQSIHRLRMLPEVGSHLMRAVFTLVVTIVAIVWLSPSSRSLAIVAAAVIVAIPVLGNLFLSEYDLRARTHAGALSRYYLGALLGLVPIRTHSAERAVRLEHESLLVEWTRAARSVQKGVVAVEGLQLFAGFGLAALLSYNYVVNESQIGAAVLIIFWGLSLPVIGQDVATLARYYPAFRNITLRLLEPMGAIEEESIERNRTSQEEGLAPAAGVSIDLRDISVVAAGHTILEDINLRVEPGAQVAIVGSSGAGKSSLFGLLLGWHRASQGEVLVDGHALDGRQLEELRRQTAWVDPSIQLWNRSLLENLRYGANDNSMTSIGNVIDSADLDHTLQQLPDGFQAILGEGGALLSGGEGQRVRLGRAMLRPKIRLVLLDESFRGLDRESRHRLLAHARKAWPAATLLCITHDISATRSFERVLVVDAGKIIEDGSPDELLRQADSRYKDLLHAEESVRRGVWSGVAWRRMQFKDGQLHELTEKKVKVVA